MRKTGALVVIAALAGFFLSGCSIPIASKVDDGRYRIRYEVGAVDSGGWMRSSMSEKASMLCPKGFTREEETYLPEGEWNSTWEWIVRCR